MKAIHQPLRGLRQRGGLFFATVIILLALFALMGAWVA
jgi:hypothetical protein